MEEISQQFDEFPCLHNHDSSDFMSNGKFERFSLRKMKAVHPFHWDLLDESGLKVVEKIVEDKDQGPLKNGDLLDDTTTLLLCTSIKQACINCISVTNCSYLDCQRMITFLRNKFLMTHYSKWRKY